jgi:branched-chain amino acid transport system substrate-binding protein
LVSAALAVEGTFRAQERYGKGKVMTGDQLRWGLENLNVTAARIESLGLTGLLRPISTSCADHEGSRSARIHQWDGKKWNFTSDWIEADTSIIKPLVKQYADKYAAEKKITRRTPAECQS